VLDGILKYETMPINTTAAIPSTNQFLIDAISF